MVANERLEMEIGFIDRGELLGTGVDVHAVDDDG